VEAITRRTGLSESEIRLLVRCYNSITLSPPAAPELGVGGVVFGKETLLNNIRSEAMNAHEDVAESGTWLETLDGNPEAPYLINDLMERIEKLSDAQAESVLYFIEGYWSRSDR
jgi:hypothetical protein